MAPIRTAFKEQKKRIDVVVTETRPRLQGAKLTVFELKSDGIPVTLITDSAAGHVVSTGLVKKVIVGADRITRDAVFNKIGTYLIALAARDNKVPFYVAAPKSTFDRETKSSHVTIEERDPKEITHMGKQRIAPRGVKVINPGFDATPLSLVDGIITEDGIVSTREVAES